MRKGIDVSKWQGKIDWEKVKKAGIEFVIIRAGYGQNNIDEYFERNIKECNRLGIPCGVYWFSYALNADMARQEARYCLAAIKPYKVEYPVCFDFEYDSVEYAKKKGITITKSLATAIADAFLNEIEKAGYYAMNYTNKDFSNKYFDMTKLDRYDLWYAWWSVANQPDMKCGIWQYTSDGKVDGIQGRVDMNIAYKDYPTIIRRAKLNRLNEEKEEHDMSNQPNQYIIAIQAALRDHGIDIGLVDGIAGPKTLEGVRQAVNRMTAAERELDKLKNSNNDVRLEQAKEYARKILDI